MVLSYKLPTIRFPSPTIIIEAIKNLLNFKNKTYIV